VALQSKARNIFVSENRVPGRSQLESWISTFLGVCVFSVLVAALLRTPTSSLWDPQSQSNCDGKWAGGPNPWKCNLRMNQWSDHNLACVTVAFVHVFHFVIRNRLTVSSVADTGCKTDYLPIAVSCNCWRLFWSQMSSCTSRRRKPSISLLHLLLHYRSAYSG
jgi:hypothetical protein